MPHAAAGAVPIISAAAALGLEVTGRAARCFNSTSHSGGDDSRPSLTFFADSNRYKCFACGVRGDLIDLVKAVRGCDFRGAVEWVEALAGGLPSHSPSASLAASHSRGTPDRQAIRVYAALYENTFAIGGKMPAGEYLQGRGLDIGLANEHGVNQIGDPDEVWELLEERFGLERLKSAGLVSRSGRFLFGRHRLLFFYLDDGWPVYVQARDLTGEAQCKELSLSGLHSPVPYNADLLRTPQERVVLCEGCVDALSALQMGLPAVGIPGVEGFRQGWFDLFQAVGHVVLLLDNDEAGRRQAAELRAQFRLRGVRADAYFPRDVKDMNDLLNKLKEDR